MALGGGVFLTRNKVLPGTYINFVSAAKASAQISDRGVAAMALVLDWGQAKEVFAVAKDEFVSDAEKLFGYAYTADKMRGLRELFMNIRTGYFYRLNEGVKADCAYATAKYGGIRGNDIAVEIEKNADDESKFDVSTYMDKRLVDIQKVSSAEGLVSNDYVDFISAAVLAATAGKLYLSGGSNGDAPLGADYSGFLSAIESYSFNTLGLLSSDNAVKGLYAEFTKRMRNECGVKFQTVLYDYAADYEGVINLCTAASGTEVPAYGLVYWATGIAAGCDINKSNTNRAYDGETAASAGLTQSQLEAAIKAGKFVLHRVGDEFRVLMDINSFTSFTSDKSEDFANNQVVRVLDQIANDIAVLFNTRYLGKAQNDKAGRISFWNDVVTYNREMERLRAIDEFSPDDVTVEQGEAKTSVIVINPVTISSAMAKLYMTVIVE